MMIKAFCSIILFLSSVCSADIYLITLFWDAYSPLVVITTPEGVSFEETIQKKVNSITFSQCVAIEIYSESDHMALEYSTPPDKNSYILNKIFTAMTEDKLTPSEYLYQGASAFQHPSSLEMKVAFYFCSGCCIDLSNQVNSVPCAGKSEASNAESCTHTCIEIVPSSPLILSVHELFLHKSFVSGLNFDYSLFRGMSLVGDSKKHYVFEKDGQKKNIYPCLVPRCNYIFSNSEARMEHRKKHFLQADFLESQGKIICCDFCKQKFAFSDSYRRHILRRHPSIQN